MPTPRKNGEIGWPHLNGVPSLANPLANPTRWVKKAISSPSSSSLLTPYRLSLILSHSRVKGPHKIPKGILEPSWPPSHLSFKNGKMSVPIEIPYYWKYQVGASQYKLGTARTNTSVILVKSGHELADTNPSQMGQPIWGWFRCPRPWSHYQHPNKMV